MIFFPLISAEAEKMFSQLKVVTFEAFNASCPLKDHTYLNKP